MMNDQQMANKQVNLPKVPFVLCFFLSLSLFLFSVAFFPSMFTGLVDSTKRLSFINCQSNNI